MPKIPVTLGWLLLVPVLSGCGKKEPPRPLVVAVGGDTAGLIVPCGCSSHQSGGLPRRIQWIEQLRQEAAGRDGEVLVLDAGGAAGGVSPYDEARFEAILRGEREAATRLHNLGAIELRFPPETLRQLAEKTGTVFLSTNAVPRDGQATARSWEVIETAGRRLLVLGVVSPQYATEHYRVAPPEEAALEAIRSADSAGKEFDAVLVLAYLPTEPLRRLAESLPEIDVLVGGPTGQPLPAERIGPVLVTSSTADGKFLVRLDWDAEPDARWESRIVEMDESLQPPGGVQPLLEQFRADLARRNFLPEETAFVTQRVGPVPEGWAVVGSARCGECHQPEYALWRQTRHASAWASLEKTGSHVDPQCQRCHTTGYGKPDGWHGLAGSDELVGVGCESCHGPSRAHAEKPAVRTPLFGRAGRHCIVCHDEENSPQFDFETYWKAIRHTNSQP